MKHQYEEITQTRLPRRTYTILRLDGRAFHTYTKKMRRPYDNTLMFAMDFAAFSLLSVAQGAKFAYNQSDESSLLLTDFEKPSTQSWFDGNVQKITSVAASVFTAAFNHAMFGIADGVATFDARVFTIPDYVEVENYFIWRQKDAERNSVQMLAQSYASSGQLHGKNIAKQHDLIHMHGDNWNDHPSRFKRGGVIAPGLGRFDETPVFTKDRGFLTDLIPQIWAEDKNLDNGYEVYRTVDG